MRPAGRIYPTPTCALGCAIFTTFDLRTARYSYMHYHGIWDLDELGDLRGRLWKILADTGGHREPVWKA